MRRVSCTVLPALLVALAPASAHGFTLRDSQSGKPARWRDESLTVRGDPAVVAIHPGASAAVSAALATWDGEPGTAPPTLVVKEGAVDELGFRMGATNRSTVRYAADGDPVAGGALAVTVVTFDTQGKILDADIVLNGGAERPWAVVDQPSVAGLSFGQDQGAYDLQNVLTHEAGHLLGFGEEPEDGEATMFVESARGETKKRALKASDVAGLHELYDGDRGDAGGVSCAVRQAPRPARRAGSGSRSSRGRQGSRSASRRAGAVARVAASSRA